MAVAHDAVSESHTGTSGSASEASFSWTHTPVGTPRGVVVFVLENADADDVTGITYGGSSLTQVPGVVANDTAGEPGYAQVWFLGSSIPTGAQTVEVTRTNNANVMYATCITVTAAANTEITDSFTSGTTEFAAALAEQALDDGSPGASSMRYAATIWGGSAVPAVGANSTALVDIDYGLRVSAVCRETNAGQGSRSVGFDTGATTDDVAYIGVCVSEAAGGTPAFVPKTVMF